MSFQTTVPILYSGNVVKSLKYYTEVLGFDCKWDWGQPPTFGGVSKDGVQVFFCEKDQGNPGTWLAIMVDDVDEYYESIKAKGAIIDSPPQTMPWGLREMLVKDHDGHIIRFGHNISHRPGTSFPLPASVRIVERRPTAEEYNQLIDAVGWRKTQPDADAESILSAPLFSVVAEEATGKAVGCALLLGDNSSFYYVKDVMVHPAWQSKNIGTEMMKSITRWLQSNAPDNALVGLFTGGYLAPFYTQFGFRHAYGMSLRVQNNLP